jgi:hypothetical protein
LLLLPHVHLLLLPLLLHLLRGRHGSRIAADAHAAAAGRHPEGVEVVRDGRLLHDLQPGVPDQVVQPVGVQHGPLLRENLVPHGELQLQLLDGQVLPLHDAVVHDPRLLELHVVELKLADPVLQLHEMLPVLPRDLAE